MRHRGLRTPNYQITNHKLQMRQRGYMLITLMLALALITIGLLTVLPEIGQQIRRDREEEVRPRGTAYMRAIQHFYKKNGRYPTRLEELENTNNIRFLRKRYKDPITGKDFKVLHVGEVQLTGAPGIAGASAIGGNAAGEPGGAPGLFGERGPRGHPRGGRRP